MDINQFYQWITKLKWTKWNNYKDENKIECMIGKKKYKYKDGKIGLFSLI